MERNRNLYNAYIARLYRSAITCSILTIMLISILPSAKAQEQKQQNVDIAINGAERICLSGSRFKFDLKANGELTIRKLFPGAETEIKIDRNETRGGTFFENQQVRQVVDQDIRACMERQWPKVIQALSGGQRSEIIQPLQPVAAPGRAGWTRDALTGCHIWNHTPGPSDVVNWDGSCKEGRAHGRGTAEWHSIAGIVRNTGFMVDGKIEGRAVLEDSRATLTANAVGGLPVNGFATLQFSDGTKIDGNFRFVEGPPGEMLSVGSVIVTGPDFKYDGPLDQNLVPNGNGVFILSGESPRRTIWQHGCSHIGNRIYAILKPVSECLNR